MVRKYSVLFVGTSAARSSAAQEALAAHGYEVSVEAPPTGGADGAHDVIAFDAPDGNGGFLLVAPRASGAQRHLRVPDIDQLPCAVREMLAPGAAAKEGFRMTRLPAAPELHALIERLPGVLFRCGLGKDGRVSFVNAAAASLTGHAPARFLGRDSRRLLACVHRADREQVLHRLHDARDTSTFAFEHRIRTRDDKVKWVAHRARIDAQGQFESFVMDITERKQAERELAWLANHDALTGVANRSLFMEQVGKSMRRAARHDERVACLFLDLDRFKHVNDTCGHAVGDELLIQVSDRLKRCIRGNDMIGRLGGDEFVVLLDGIAEPQDAAAAAAKILEALNRPYRIHGRSLTISASIGISCYPGDADDRGSLLRNADAAMYAVKSSGRHGYRFHSRELSEQAFATMAMASALGEALRNDALQLAYQPRVALETGAVQAVEALARWHNAEHGDIAPMRLLTVAEEAGLLSAFNRWTLESACRDAVARDTHGMPLLRTCVNVSAQQFRDASLLPQVRQALYASGLDPVRLELEIPEHAIMHDPTGAADTLRQLKSLQLTLSVDGFGSGYTSLQLLKKLHIDFLKLDRSIIGGVPHNGDDAAIVEAIVAMAGRLGLKVVAQGIETEEQGAFARMVGCDEGQGFLYCRPSPETDVRRFLAKRVH